jgi:hypothetical protein
VPATLAVAAAAAAAGPDPELSDLRAEFASQSAAYIRHTQFLTEQLSKQKRVNATDRSQRMVSAVAAADELRALRESVILARRENLILRDVLRENDIPVQASWFGLNGRSGSSGFVRRTDRISLLLATHKSLTDHVVEEAEARAEGSGKVIGHAPAGFEVKHAQHVGLSKDNYAIAAAQVGARTGAASDRLASPGNQRRRPDAEPSAFSLGGGGGGGGGGSDGGSDDSLSPAASFNSSASFNAGASFGPSVVAATSPAAAAFAALAMAHKATGSPAPQSRTFAARAAAAATAASAGNAGGRSPARPSRSVTASFGSQLAVPKHNDLGDAGHDGFGGSGSGDDNVGFAISTPTNGPSATTAAPPAGPLAGSALDSFVSRLRARENAR